MDVFPDYTKFNRTKKVMAALQIISEENADANASREACKAVGE